MSADKNHIIYSAADIEKYHRGELSPAAMHAMERAALDDPFLADAMEGYADTNANGKPSERLQSDLADLRQRVSDRVNEKKEKPVVAFAWWKIAAIVVVLLGAGWLYKAMNSGSGEQGMVASNKPTSPQPPTPAGQGADSLAARNNDTLEPAADLALNEKKEDANYKGIRQSPKQSAAQGSAPLTVQQEANRDELERSASDTRLQSALPGRTVSKEVNKNDSSSIAPLIVAADQNKTYDQVNTDKKEKALEEALSKAAPAAGAPLASNFFNGTVVDQSNKPVANATVQVPDLNKAFVTDDHGKFSFKAPDTAVNISVASVGFAQQNTRLSNNIGLNNQIVLQPDTKGLNDVVVVGYGSKKKAFRSQSKDFSINVLDAAPSVDWNAYTEYLERNKRIAEDTKNIHGDVVVSFVINNKNELTSFKIDKPLQPALDAEAIRLIKEGPSWKLLRGKKAKASVIVKF